VRARQTAEVLSAVLAEGARVAVRDQLAPGQPSAAVLEAVRGLRGARSVMVVGHEPDLGRLASYVLTGSASRANLPFKKGGTAAFELGDRAEGERAELLWFLMPRQLRALGHES
jgi:phosphohistidine phosphatase